MTDTTPGVSSGPGTATAATTVTPQNGSRNGAKEVRQVERVVIRFAGDSGDGMQLTGERFTSEYLDPPLMGEDIGVGARIGSGGQGSQRFGVAVHDVVPLRNERGDARRPALRATGSDRDRG